MNDLERRLHHAARELRSIDIEPPPFASVAAPGRPSGLVGRVPALVMPVLFVLGGLAVVAGGLGRTTEVPDAQSNPPAVEVTPIAAQPGRIAGETSAPILSVHQELALIASLAPAAEPTPSAGIAESASAPVRTLSRQFR